MTEIKLRWDNEPGIDRDEAEAAIRKDLSSSMYADIVTRPWDLMTHTVFLGPSMDEGPVIHMWGVEGDDHFHCRWEDEIRWISLKEWELEEEEQAALRAVPDDQDELPDLWKQ